MCCVCVCVVFVCEYIHREIQPVPDLDLVAGEAISYIRIEGLLFKNYTRKYHSHILSASKCNCMYRKRLFLTTWPTLFFFNV